MNDTSRIAHLSPALREQINHRLLNGDSDGVILKWLHTSGEVWALIQQRFQHSAFTSRDLDEWRAGAFAEWKLRREVALAAQGPAPDYSANGQLKTSARQLADQLAENLAGHYARLMHHWDGDATTEFTARLRALTHLCRDICALRKSEHQAALIKLAEAKHALRQKKADAETEAAFLKRLDQPGMRDRILNHYNNTPSPQPTAHSPQPTAHHPAPSPRSNESCPIKPNQATSGVSPSRPDLRSSTAPTSPAPSAHSPQPGAHRPPPTAQSLRPTPQSDSIKPNQASSGVGTARPHIEPEPSAQSPEPTAHSPTPSPGLGTQSQSLEPSAQSLVRPNQTKSRDSKVTSNVLPGDPGYVEDDAPDIYSIPNPAIAARKPKKEEPIVRGFVSMVNYGPSERRNDVHY